jgi:Carbamoylphosphate synthase large subunit (split gene in MJ)
MILLSEYRSDKHKSAGMSYLKKMEETVRLLGGEVINFDKNNLELINSPKQFSKSEYFDQFYPFIKEHTIESGIATSLIEAKSIARRLGYPIFLKGTIQSLKKFGWENCVATNEVELEKIFNKLAAEKDFSLGKIILRKFIKLRYNEIGGNGIPKAHEYRFFVLNEEIIDYSFYWNGENPFNLNITDLEALKKTVINIAKKIKVPFISVDVGETLNDGWKVIEIGDGQFSDIRNISALKIWNHINKN